MSRTNLKRYLMLLAVIGLVAIASGGGSGTFASFNAEVANQGNYFATGTLFLHNTHGLTTCTSESAPNNLNISNTGDACATLFTINPLADSSTHFANLTLTNAGSINAQDIKFNLASTCADTVPSIATLGTGFAASDPITSLSVGGSDPTQTLVAGTKIIVDDGSHPAQTFTVQTTSNAGSGSIDVVDTTAANNLSVGAKITIWTSWAGSANLCSGIQVYVQETDSDFSTPVGCAYGVFTGNTCNYDASKTLGGIGTTPVPLTLASGASGNTLTDLTAGQSRFFVINAKAPAFADNTYQNDQVLFDLQWRIDQ